MGKCLSKDSSASIQKNLPTITSSTISTLDLDKLLRYYLTGKPCLHYSDREYQLHDIPDIKKFLKEDLTNKLKYIPEKFDCDDFSWVVLGRQREWYRQTEHTGGSAFGVVWGDIRLTPEHDTPHYHACNFFVDLQGKFWLVEPQNDKIYPLYENSQVNMLIV